MAKSTQSGLEKLKMLVIDDHRNMRDLMKFILSGLGVGFVATAPDSAAAFSEMRAFAPDIVFVDWAMEPLDGLDFVRLVRNASDSPDPFVPIVMMSGHTEYGRIIEARDAGVTEFLAKPLSAMKVAQRIENIIHRPRPYVRTGSYFGPDRRRQTKNFRGTDRRIPSDSLLTEAEINALLSGGERDD